MSKLKEILIPPVGFVMNEPNWTSLENSLNIVFPLDFKEFTECSPVYNFCLINEIKNIRTQHLVV